MNKPYGFVALAALVPRPISKGLSFLEGSFLLRLCLCEAERSANFIGKSWSFGGIHWDFMMIHWDLLGFTGILWD